METRTSCKETILFCQIFIHIHLTDEDLIFNVKQRIKPFSFIACQSRIHQKTQSPDTVFSSELNFSSQSGVFRREHCADVSVVLSPASFHTSEVWRAEPEPVFVVMVELTGCFSAILVHDLKKKSINTLQSSYSVSQAQPPSSWSLTCSLTLTVNIMRSTKAGLRKTVLRRELWEGLGLVSNAVIGNEADFLCVQRI